MLTPENDWEKSALKGVRDGANGLKVYDGVFYECRGGYTRMGMDDVDERSVILVVDGMDAPVDVVGLAGEVERLKAENEVLCSQLNTDGTKKNPALENVLAKLRGIFERGRGFHNSLFIKDDLTLGDLQRWVESEKANG